MWSRENINESNEWYCPQMYLISIQAFKRFLTKQENSNI